MSIIPEQLTTQSFTKPIPLSSLLNKLTNKSLCLNAEYQRDEVWSAEKKTKLIQSILGGVTIPSIIINEKEEKKIVIDGKQRIVACRDFKNNIINFFNESDPEITCKYEDFDTKYKEYFDDYSINCIVYKNLTEEEERDIFQRINYGENLTTGEKIKGMKSNFLQEIIKVKDNISQYLNNIGITQNRESYIECTIALLALYNNDNEYVSKKKLSIEYLNKITKNKDNINMDNFSSKINITLKLLNEIYTETFRYSKSRKYAKKTYSKLKWTDVLIYIKIIFSSEKLDDTKKELISVIKYLIHISNGNVFVSGEHKSETYLKYHSILDKRSITNIDKFFEDRIHCIKELYKYINKCHSKTVREQIYAKSGTAGESICVLCNTHKIYLTNFHASHIISKKNGGSPESSNGYPSCGYCNTSMGSQDLDTYAKENKITLRYLNG